MRYASLHRILLAIAILLAVLAAPRAAWASIKLCMKDGTYQVVSSYEIHGDRVRYFSVERSEWEEVPTNLVDLDATKRAQDETKALQKKQLEDAKEVEQERFYKPPNQGLEVAPGIRLPGDDGIFRRVDVKRPAVDVASDLRLGISLPQRATRAGERERKCDSQT